MLFNVLSTIFVNIQLLHNSYGANCKVRAIVGLDNQREVLNNILHYHQSILKISTVTSYQVRLWRHIRLETHEDNLW